MGADVQATVSGAVDELSRRVAQSAPHARVTWVKPAHLHLTLRFIGEADAALGEKIRGALNQRIVAPAFLLTIKGIGTFPPRRPPRVIWAGIAGGLEALRAVERELRARLDRLLPSVDERDFHPHVTLGRVKNPAGLRPAVLLDGLTDAAFGVVPVGAVTLFESRLSSAGPTYVALGRTPLAPTS
jgi:RNA 2',3'-cyclic 3'-phosphodiesterase